MHNQDLKIATLAWEAGRGLIIVVNKWDIYPEKGDKSADRSARSRGEGAVPPTCRSCSRQRSPDSACTKVLDVVLDVDTARKRISTSELNDRLQELLARRQPPQAAGLEVKLNYATQVEVAPPTIAVFGNHPELVVEHYIRFLHNGFRETYPFTGSPLRIVLRRKNAAQ
jgi:GTPase